MIAHFDASPTNAPAASRERGITAISDSTAAERAGTGKLAARVARQIEQDVLRTGWPVGQVLGSETELRERYQVSRAVLREAIRLVEHHQVAAMRRGPAGGLVVRAPDAGAATSAMVVYLEFVGTTIEHLLTARLMIEPLAAALAAENITEAGIAQLRAALADEFAAGPNRDGHTRSALHLTLAELSGNPALHLFVDVLLRLTWRYAGDQLNHLPEDPLHPAFTSSDISHEAMVDSVVAGDGPRAQYLVGQHLEMFGDFLIHWRPDTHYPPSTLWTVPTPGHTQDQKLAEVVAQRLLAEITGGGWAVGSVIGSEAALLDRFEVSRAVLREAVRLLEYHSVARMRRGPGGGLVVAEPDPSASIEAMALYLDFQGIEIDHLRAVREAVELACLDRVAARVGEPEVARRLRAVLHGAEAANPFGDGTPPEHLGELSHLLHVELAELAGNPVLALFLRILITLWARQGEVSGAGSPESSPEAGAAVARAHQGIVDALLVGDGGLARHRMRRHLSVLTEWWQ
ncbi:MAG TPA: FCD domain-containing protein [Pseudonocardia sp.]|nr:FCD domain-containing protein [Pseudonocardia sp.]